jgi:hypothetical protein
LSIVGERNNPHLFVSAFRVPVRVPLTVKTLKKVLCDSIAVFTTLLYELRKSRVSLSVGKFREDRMRFVGRGTIG